MRPLHLLPLVLLLVIPATADAQWTWTAETGWVNTRYVGVRSPKDLFARAEALEKTAAHKEAAEIYKKVADKFPNTDKARDALFKAAENKFKGGEYIESNALYETYVSRHGKDKLYPRILKRRYEIGRALVRGQKRRIMGLKWFSASEQGEKILRGVINEYPFDKKKKISPDEITDDAMFVLATHHLKEKRYDEAEDGFRALRKRFPDSEWAQTALYQIAVSQKERSAGPKYDSKGLKDARKTLEKYEKEAPEGKKIKEAKKQVKQLTETLAEKDYKIALFYYNKGRHRAAKVYFARVKKAYPGTRAAAKAANMLKKIK